MLPRGLVLVTGLPAAVFTTLAAVITKSTNTAKIMSSPEDPIEYKHNHINSIINQRSRQ
ncbi:MAG: hypothetical protein ACLR2G_02825 [Phascolarctobacterium faecium]